MSTESNPNPTPAPLRVTSGAGFDFEDRVSAWLLMKMLVGEPVPGIGGRGTMIQAQVAALHWKIDDLLVTSLQNDGSVRKLALSCKGNVQVSGTALPASFVSAAWAQWHHPELPLSTSNDHLALVTAARHAEFDATWREVKNACSGADAALGLGRIRDNPKQLRLFESVREKGPTERASETETCELIRRLEVLPIELHAADALRENEAIAQCRQLLVTGDLAEAEQLWERLLNMAKRARLEYGTIPLLDAWEQLRTSFALRDHLDYRSDWTILAAYSADQRQRIDTALPNGHVVARAAESAKLREGLRADVVTFVTGESGSGKSALVKHFLDTELPTAAQLWLGPEATAVVLSAVQRGTAGLRHDLRELLRGTSARENVLVLDSAEHLDAIALSALMKALSGLAAGGASDRAVHWRVVVTAQPRGLPQLTAAFSGHASRLVELGPLSSAEVKEAVEVSPALSWLTSHESTIEALTSLKALAWVLGAGAGLVTPTATFASHIAVVDALWRFWTQDNIATQVLLMQLGEREAGPDRSFPISTLNAGQQQAFQAGRASLPLRLDPATNHLRFEHDLAADWARFQRLKELSNDPHAWAALASNPLWTNALRLLGQHLLRRGAEGGTAWDEAFGADSPHAGLVQGILFDAICLDPHAQRFLTERADWLLDESGRRLNQLLTRFLHIATVPAQAIRASGGWLELHAETHRRVIVIGRWVPMLQFVLAQAHKLEGLLSSSLARFTHTWLIQSPATLDDNRTTPFRHELADLALAVARSIQVHKGSGDILVDLESEFYAAALAGAPDRPTEVSDLALELSGRRAIDAQTATRIQAIVSERQAQHEQRLAADPGFRARHDTTRRMGGMSGLGREKLPPWPIGAKHRVDQDFRKACFKNGVLEPLMRVAPAVAAEVLLALIVEDKPERDLEAGRHPYRDRLGLDYPVDAFPSIFWKSPFWPFLQIAPNHAVEALLQLVAFCTDRWAAGSRAHGLVLTVAGDDRAFVGGPGELAWSQATSTQTGNLHCALDSLERWLVTRIDEGLDVSSTVNRLLSDSNSVAILGLLVNVGKHHPLLFEGPLSPLLAKAELYAWDAFRVGHVEQNFDANFVSSGEQLFDLERHWVLAPHRRRELVDVAIGLIRANPVLADDVRGWTAQWTDPDDVQESLEQRITAARLDSVNYRTDDEGTVAFVPPVELVQEVQAWQQTHAPARQQLTAPYACQQLLDADQPIGDEQATELWEILALPPHEEDWVQQRCERAVAAALTVLAPNWLARHAAAKSKVESVFESALASLPSTAEELSKARFPTTHTGIDFVASALARQWAVEASPEASRHVVRLVTSGDRLAANTTVMAAYQYRKKLGDRWWRLLHVGVLWSGLTMLAPRYGDVDAVERVWTHWWKRLRRISLDQPCQAQALDLARVDRGCARLMFRRQMRAFKADPSRRHPDHLAGAGLDTDSLDGLFGWLLRGPGSGDREMDIALVSRFWALEVEHARDHAREENGELHLPGHFAYHVLEKLAALALTEPEIGARRVWQQVLELGPTGHYAVQHFASALFLGLSKGADPQRFELIWKALADYALAADWNLPKLWFYGEQMRRSILGFGSEWVLEKLPAGAALRMQGTLGNWAKTHLRREDNLAGFALFLASPFGAPLRFDGLLWINTSLTAPDTPIGFHRDACGDALIDLILTLLQNDLAALRKRADAHAALLDIAAALAATGRQGALAIQDRLRATLTG
ncbi:MAG: ATP-binding protein [Rhizobium sp.]|nr:ATP-binding protein [Rhizobium sp.]